MGEFTLENFLRPALRVFSLVLLGIAIRVIVRRARVLKKPGEIGFRFLNLFALWVILPVVVFVSISRYPLGEILGFGNAFLLALVGLGTCFVLAVGASYAGKHDRKTTIAIVLNSAFMNVVYLGFPIVYALVGLEGLGPAALYAMTIGIPHLIFGITFASAAAKKRVTPGFVFGSVFTFPAAFALIVALVFVGFRAPLPPVACETFDTYLAMPFFALLLLLVGYQMPLVSPRKYVSVLTTVGMMRFLICPLVTYAAIFMLGLNVATDLTPKPALIQSIMPPAIFNMILAYNYKLDVKLYGAVIFYLTLVSLFIAMPLLYFLIF